MSKTQTNMIDLGTMKLFLQHMKMRCFNAVHTNAIADHFLFAVYWARGKVYRDIRSGEMEKWRGYNSDRYDKRRRQR